MLLRGFYFEYYSNWSISGLDNQHSSMASSESLDNMQEDILERESRALLLQLLQEHFGSQVELVNTTIANRLLDYTVLLATLRHPSLAVVIKLAGPQAPYLSSFDRTALLHRLVAAHTTISMPEVLAVDVSYQKWPWRYLITTCLPGQEWANVRGQLSQQELHYAYQQIGQAVAQLHTISFPRFGEVAPDAAVPSQETYLSALTTSTVHSHPPDSLQTCEPAHLLVHPRYSNRAHCAPHFV